MPVTTCFPVIPQPRPELNTELYKHVHIQCVVGVREVLSTTFGAGCDIGLGGLLADVGRDCDACDLEH